MKDLLDQMNRMEWKLQQAEKQRPSQEFNVERLRSGVNQMVSEVETDAAQNFAQPSLKR